MPARVGLLTVDITVTDSITLKDKRQVVRSLLDRLTVRFNVSAAEVDRLDSRRRAQLGFSCVSNDGGHVREMLQAVLDAVLSDPRAVVEDSEIEVF